jgi:hypothetical protein
MSLYPLEEMRYLNLTDPQAETFAEARGEFGELPITSGRQRKAKNVSLLEGYIHALRQRIPARV